MNYSNTPPELADLNEQLPYADSIAEAHWLAELACMCHRRLDGKTYPAGFWGLLDVDDAKHLRRFLNDSRDGVSNAANDLQVLVESAPEPTLLCECDDVYDIATDAIRCIAARLRRLGIQLESPSSDALKLALEKVLGEAEVALIDAEETPVNPNELPQEVEGMFSLPNLTNDFQVMAEQSNERFLSLVDKTIRDNADKPELIAEIREIAARSMRCQAALDKHREEET